MVTRGTEKRLNRKFPEKNSLRTEKLKELNELQNQKQEILFHQAIIDGDLKRVKEYIEIFKVDINCIQDNRNGFEIAIEKNRLEIIKYFLSKCKNKIRI